MKTRVALFGGSFDPPHKAHEQIPLFLLDHHFVEEVWYVPVKLHPFGKNISADSDRLAMIEKIVTDLVKNHPEYQSKIRVEQWELDNNPLSYTINTLDGLTAKYLDHSFQWVIGTDNLEKFHLWHAAERILNEYGVLVYPREGYRSEPLLPGMQYLEHAPSIPVSSTQLRQQLKDSSVISADVLLPEVKNYALGHHLYSHGINK